MKIEQQLRDDHQVTLTVEVEPERFEKAKRRAARKLSRKAKIPGFRPGKAPYDVIRSFLGEGAIVEEAVEILIDEIYPEALEEAEIEPAAAGSLDEIASLEPPTFVFTVPLRPQVDLGDYEAIRVDYTFEAPNEEKVDEAIDELRRMFARTEEVNRPIEDGDYVLAAVTLFPAGEEDAEPLESRESFAFVVRAEAAEDEWPYAGFSAELIGLKAGESKTLTYTFPEETEDEQLRGQETRIEVEIKTVRALELPSLDDEFAQQAGAQNLEALREAVRESLVRQAQEEYDDEFYAQVLDAIKEQAVIKYPPQMVEDEVEAVLRDLESRLEAQGLNLDLYLRSQDKTREAFIEEEVRPTAIKRLERSLIMDEIARRAKIELDDDELEAEFQALLNELQFSGQIDFSKLRTKRQQKEFAEIATYQAANRLITRRVLEHLKQVVTGAAEQAADEAEAEDQSPAEAAEPETPSADESAAAETDASEE